jgi:hypothetical protein
LEKWDEILSKGSLLFFSLLLSQDNSLFSNLLKPKTKQERHERLLDADKMVVFLKFELAGCCKKRL